jgi:RNA polymerase sigma-70 factor (ECF subfamily)
VGREEEIQMTEKEKQRLEADIKGCWEQKELGRSVELAIRGYGPEIRIWLRGMAGEQAAQEIFSILCEDLWKGLPSFRWESSFRTWLYRLARSAWFRYRCSPELVRGVELRDSIVSLLPHQARSQTDPWMKTEVKDSFKRLWDHLDLTERQILTLRVNRKMAWEDVAQIVADEEHEISQDEIRKRAAALRQQFQRLKARLRQLAIQDGLLAAA